jgi:thiamine biosynthesis lipoprotein
MTHSSYAVKVSMLIVAILMLNTGVAWNLTHQKAIERFEVNGYAQGTTYHIIYYAPNNVVTNRQTDSLLRRLDTSVSLYLPGSMICKFNQSDKGISIDEPFRVLISKALEINHATDGAVDVTVKSLVDAWGFGVKKATVVPGDERIKGILKNVGSGRIWLEGNFLHKKFADVQIDLNGIAQGYSADLLAALLEQYHISNYVVEIGGELRIKGQKPEKEPFKIGIEAIDGNDVVPSPLRKVIAPGDGAVTTSGNYRKHLEANGKKISHIIDPKTGYPATNEMISVTVWAKDGITADGYDNGFMVMGLKKTLRFLEKRTDIGAYIIYKKDNGAVADTVTSGFKGYNIY